MSAVPYTFANASGQVPASELDVNFANVKAAVDTAGIVTTNAQPNITSVGTLTALSVTANVTGGNVLTSGRVSATGNVSGSYILGNGSQLTGIVAVSTYGNANVVTLLADFGSNLISTTGNITAGNILPGGYVSAVGNVRGGNIVTAGAVIANELIVNQTANSWQISGNTLTAPSGAFWNSNPEFQDEYITSAVDGYINLTSRYANGNTASQVHLEHGLAQIVVDNGSEYIWAFDSTGNLTLPSNVASINYANGDPYGGSSGPSNYGNANVVTLLANFGSNLISTTGNINTTIGINVGTFVLGSSNVLNIGTTAANSTIRIGNSTPTAILIGASTTDALIEIGSTTSNVFIPGQVNTTGNITAGNVLPSGYVSAVGNVGGGNISAANAVITNELIVNRTGNTWQISGNTLTAPSGAFWNSNPAFQDEYITSAVDGYINLTSRYANGNTASQVHLEHGLAQIVVDNGSEYIWAFDDTGDLSAPGNVSATGNVTGGNLTTSGQVSATANITGNNLVASGLISAVGNVTGANLNVGSGNVNVGNVVFALDSSKFNSAKWTLVETFANLNNYSSSGNSSVDMTQTFNYYATNYNEFMIKLAPVPAYNPYNNPIFYTNIALNSVSSGDVINIATTWNNSPGATDIEFAYVTWANLATTGLVIYNPNTGAGDNPSTNLYIYAR